MGFFDSFRKPAPATPQQATDPHSDLIHAARNGDVDSLARLVGGGMLGNVQVIGDTTHITQEQRDKLKAFGIDIDAVIASGGANLQVAAPHDSVGALERLAALRDRGALTEAEFQAEKKKVLGA